MANIKYINGNPITASAVDLANGSLNGAALTDGTVTTAKVADGAVTLAKLGDDIEIEPPDGSITTAKIADGAVTDAKLATNGLISKSVYSAGRTINSASLVVSPYDDLNTLPNNEIVKYIKNTVIASIDNMPSGAVSVTSSGGGVIVVPLASTSNRTYSSVVMQLALAVSTTAEVTGLYYRSCYGGEATAVWSDWTELGAIGEGTIGTQQLADGSVTDGKLSAAGIKAQAVYGSGKIINSTSLLVAPYDDLDTLPNNEILTYSSKAVLSTVGHAPDSVAIESGGGFTIVSLSRSTDRGYASLSMQLLIYTDTNVTNVRTYTRANYGNAQQPRWSEWSRIDGYDVDAPFISLGMFSKVGVIGDSYSNGATQRANGTYIQVTQTGRYVSWLQILARRNGFVGSNFTKGGLTTRTWLTDEEGLTALQAADPQDAYFVMLGVNDSNDDDRYVAVGQLSDFDNSSNPPDTFYGNMGVIYRAIQTKNDKAVVVYCTCCRFGDRYEPYSAAIRAIAEHTGTLLIDFERVQLVKSTWWSESIVGSHPSAKMYDALATAIEREFSKAAYVGNQKLNVYYG